MSWALDDDPFWEFESQANRNHSPASPFSLDIWENTPDQLSGRWIRGIKDANTLRSPPTGLRIVLAPLDLPQKSTKVAFLELFRTVGIPPAFVRERIQSVSHSFGSVSSPEKFCAWFHFLCKHIQVEAVDTPAGSVPTVAHLPVPGYAPPSAVTATIHGRSQTMALQRAVETRTLPQADYSYTRSSFFLDASNTRTVTLCCFGASSRLRQRLDRFLESQAWNQALDEPCILLDIILDGLFMEVDDNVWSMNDIFGALEHRLLFASTSRVQTPKRELAFAELHNVAKHIIHLREAVESCLFLCESILLRLRTSDMFAHQARSDQQTSTRQQLRDLLLYRQSLFRSTKLRLNSLNQRVSNSIALAFNLLTSADSTVLIQHSNIMKIMAALTILFLPTTAVAAIVGSQLFDSRFEDGVWAVRVTPLFGYMWAVALPLTVAVLISASCWHWSTRSHNPEKVAAMLRRKTGF